MGAVVGVAGVVVAMLVGRPILTILFTADFAAYTNILVLVMVAGVFMYMGSFTGFAMTAARYLTVQVPVNLVVVGVILAGSWALIGPYGLTGAALVLIGGAVARFLIQGLIVVGAIVRRRREPRAAKGG
jgi:O-antigen/teichoic acid export membrane protein